MFPSNGVVQETGHRTTDIAEADPVASMSTVDNRSLAPTAEEIGECVSAAMDTVSGREGQSGSAGRGPAILK